MDAKSRKFLTDLLQTPSPSGFEQPAQRIIKKYLQNHADRISTDVHGNTVAAINPQGSPRIMLAGHVDQIGFMIRYISDDGFLHFAPIGGIDPSVVPGLVLQIHTAKGIVHGVVGRKPIHQMKPEERKKAQLELSDLWLDIGAKDKNQAESRVAVGDPITYRLGVTELDGDLIASPGTDDKVGAYVVMETLKTLANASRKLQAAVFAVATVQEELGLRGARTSCFDLDPQVGIAVDVTHAADYPGADKKQTGNIVLGGGPAISIGPNINQVLGHLLQESARAKKIPYQPEAQPSATPTDANVIQINRAGVASALVSVPNRYMHTPVEVVHIKDIDNTVKLLAETVIKINKKTDFVPK